MKILFDTNILLDFLLQREPFFTEVAPLFKAIATGQIIGHVTATTITDIFYIARKHTKSIVKARQSIATILVSFDICPIDRYIIEAAYHSDISDFEDAVQIFAAIAQDVDAIVTRDRHDFENSPLPIYSPTELLEQI
ncbi:PIN domain-containing protein [[Limnothrix rosea] IAM M-220]|uniref:PIN domain-containing protein n=1 Tax=[Limnothrix rosea] IAM M-220 TaxID=454133 RepID=UPI00095EF1BE|nr:PIN domain-containing protein [[Limnothrix rosea] IAM M-220]OKH17576.1 DNA-binding protein [[Limnothrix rosea] IAM M-220]